MIPYYKFLILLYLNYTSWYGFLFINLYAINKLEFRELL